MRYLIAILMMGMLSACGMTASPSATTTNSATSSPSSSESAMALPSVSASLGETAMTCQEAWNNVDSSQVTTLGDLTNVSDQIDATIQACDNVDQWTQAAQDALPDIQRGDILGWAADRCSANDTLNQTPVCVEVPTVNG